MTQIIRKLPSIEEINFSNEQALIKIIKIAGGESRLRSMLGLSVQRLQYWKDNKRIAFTAIKTILNHPDFSHLDASELRIDYVYKGNK